MKTTKDKIFFSYGTVAQLGEPAYRAMKQFLDDFYSYGPPEVLYKYDPLGDEVAIEAAKLLHCQPMEITTTKNTTEGINIASEALPLQPGDEVLVQGNEYPSNLLPWLKKKKDGVIVSVIHGTDSVVAFQALITAISSRTRVIAISSAQYYDGYMADISLLSELCRQKNIFLVLDAAQTVGIRHIDLQKTPVDFLVCGGQKYLQAGMGNGFLYVNQSILSHLKDTKVGIRSMEHFDEENYTLKQNADRFQDGTQNLAGIVALHASLKSINSIGIDVIEAKNMALLKDIKVCLADYGIAFIDHDERQSNILSMKVSDPSALFDYLKERSVYIRPIKDIARLSFIHESRLEDVETTAKLIRQWIDSTSS